jgi:hypothetical protein
MLVDGRERAIVLRLGHGAVRRGPVDLALKVGPPPDHIARHE